MAKYRFEQWDVDIENPELEIIGLSSGNPQITYIDFPTKKYNVDISLFNSSTRLYNLNLKGVQSISLNWEDGSNDITAQVWDRLNDYLVE